jgi:hypothetical protein
MSMSRPDDRQARLLRLRALARLLDSAWEIPGTRFTVGLDALIGLVPGLGDMVGSIVSGYVLLESARMGAPASLLSRMFFNIVMDSVTGSVPVAGDVFDAFFKANIRNVDLLEHHFQDPRAARRKNIQFVVIVLLLCFTFLAAFAFLMAALFVMFVRLLGV